MGVADVLRDHVASLAFDFLLLANNFNSTSATKSVWFHNVHVLVPICFTLGGELAEVIREQVGAGTEVELLGEESLHSRAVFPH